MTVHLLVASADRTVSTGCGLVVEMAREPGRYSPKPPENVTGWGSEVTCPECLARRSRP